MDKDQLNIYSIEPIGVKSLGPGNRFGIWVQGCPFFCKGCMTPNGIPIVINKLISIDSLVKMIVDSKLTGLTISGGEPFLQASKLAILIKKARTIISELNVIVYSGYNIIDLQWNGAKLLLEQTDLLIDGRFVEKLNEDRGIRGSSNQKFHYLSDKLLSDKSEIESRIRHLEIKFNRNTLELTGIPTKR